jgi:recA bacterial DNA recombination protein
MAEAALPLRDAESRGRLHEVARRAVPVVAAGELVLPVPGPLGETLPGGGMRRGTVVAVAGPAGAGATTLGLRLVAAATAAGEWAAVVEAGATLGGLAAIEAGVAPSRLAVVRAVPRGRWVAVVAALLDGVGLVVAEVPVGIRVGDARRLTARARERGAVLVTWGEWPAEAALRLRARGRRDDVLEIEVEGRGAAARPRLAALAG